MSFILFVALFLANQAPVQTSLQRALELHANGHQAEALVLYDEHLAATPEDARVLFFAARAADHLGQTERVQVALERARELAPENANLCAWQILWLADHGHAIDVEAFRDLTSLNPSDLTKITVYSQLQIANKFGDPAMEHMARVVIQFRHFDAVRRVYRDLLPHVTKLDIDLALLDLEPGDDPMNWDDWSLDIARSATTVEGLTRWGEAVLALRNHGAIVERLAPLTDMVASSPELAHILMQAYGSRRNYGAALAVAEAQISRAGDNVVVKVEAATLLARQQELEAADAMIERARARDPRHPRVLLYLAQVAIHESRNDDARALLTTIIEADPLHVLALDTLAKLEMKLGQNLRSAQLTERVLLQQPWRTFSWLRCASEFARGGHFAKAREVLERAYPLGVTQEMSKAIVDLIDNAEAKQNGTQQQ